MHKGTINNPPCGHIGSRSTVQRTEGKSSSADQNLQVAALENRAREILHRVACLRNPLRPINRLPPEIIALCAAFVPRADPRPIFSLTHVCRYWRGAITSNPGCWTLIGSGWKLLVPLCLERAGIAPLTVDMSMRGLKRKFVQALLPHVTRISGLSLTDCTSLKHMETILSSPMLNPTSLMLEAPELAEIHLYPVLSNIKYLVELKLVQYKISFEEFIGFLESNTYLEILELAIQFTGIPVLTALERGVLLPQLRHLALTCDDPIDARALLSSLTFPRGINIEVHGSPRNLYPDLTSFLPSPPTLIQDLLAPITTVKYLRNKGQLYLSGKNGSFSFYNRIRAPNHYKEFDLFATGAVREFHLHFYSADDPLSLPLERLPALEALVIHQPDCRGSLSVLAEEPMLCPSLKTIAFSDCWVTDTEIKLLEGVLAKRQHSIAARLHRVVIANHTYNFPKPESVSRLRMFVSRVDIVAGDELPDLL